MHLKSKRMVSLLLVALMVMTMFTPAMAAVSTTGDTPVSLTAEAAIFNVSVPTVLPVDADAQGNITVSDSVRIVNSSWGPIYVAGLDVTPQNGWTIKDYNANMYEEKVNAKKIAMIVNNCKTTSAGSIAYSAANFPSMEGRGGNNWIGIDYNAKLPAHKVAMNKTVPMNVLFTIAWLKDDNTGAPDNPNGETHNLTFAGDTPSALTLGEETTVSAVQDAGTFTWESSNPDVVELEENSASLSIFNPFILTAHAEDGSITSTAKLKAVGLGKSTISVANEIGDKASMEVIVVKNELTGLTVVTMPTKTVYEEGETFNPAGMVVEGTYANGEKYTINHYGHDTEPLVAGQDSVRIWYTEQGITQETYVNITVNKVQATLDNIAVTTAPTKTTYIEGETFNPEGMVVTAYYSNGTSKAITDYTTNKGVLALNDANVVVTYNEKSCTTPVTVIAKELSSIAVTTVPTKTSYIEGQNFDVTGMVVTATYNNGSTEAITDYNVADGVALKLDQTVVTVEYGGKSCTVPVTVNVKELTKIKVTTAPTKTTYTKGETFDPSGMVVTAYYNNDTFATVSDYMYSKEPFAGGETSVTITYNGKSCATPITVANTEPVPANVTDYYTFTDDTAETGGYRVGLNTNFRTALIKNTAYKDWNPGNPLPNPGATYSEKPVTSMKEMFYSCKIDYLNLNNFDTSNIVDMSFMFSGNSTYALFETKSLHLENLNTSNVVNMEWMFARSSIPILDLRNFNTSNVNNMRGMFYNISNLTSLNINNLDTSNVTDMGYMFAGCQINDLDLSFFNTSNVTDMTSMFASCSASTYNFDNWDTSNVINMYSMFYNCKASVLDISSFTTNLVSDTDRMFMNSRTTTGYARTQADANKFNASSDKPSTLTFVIKRDDSYHGGIY